jgi:DNA-binding XRE family transcriptional regulator
MTSAYESGQEPEILVRHRLRIAREYAGLEQEELAEMIGVNRHTISNAEKGRVQPRKITINAWALACGVPASWIKKGGRSNPPDHGPTLPENVGPTFIEPVDWLSSAA